MALFRNMLAISDGAAGPAAGAALDDLCWLARATGARVTLLAPEGTGTADAASAGAAAGLAAERSAEAAAVARLHAEGIAAEVLRCRAPLVEAAVARVRAAGHDLVLRLGAPGGAAGVLDLALLRLCPCPVWLPGGAAPAGAADRAGARILAAVDPDPGDALREGLNRRVLEAARLLAAREGARLVVLSAWVLQQEAALRQSLNRLPGAEVERIVAAEERQNAWRLETLMKDFADIATRAEVRLVKGPAAEVIPAEAAGPGAATLVLGLAARPGPRAAGLGRTAEAVLARMPCAVLAMRPAAEPAALAEAGA